MNHILLFAWAILLICLSAYVYSQKSDYKIIPSLYRVKNEIKIETEKAKVNKDVEKLAEILRLWAEYNGERYPKGGYLEAFNEIFPKDIGSLNLLTFLEWWSSDFVNVDNKTIRIDSDVVKSFKNLDPVDNGTTMAYPFDLTLNGDPDKIQKFLYNLMYNNKIPKYTTKISEKYNNDTNTLEKTLEIIFFISK